MEISKENSKFIEELQGYEQHLQNFLAQKQMMQVELQEVSNALNELNKTKDEVYKILSGIMMKTDKNSLTKDLEERKKLFELRISSIEKQEHIFEDKTLKLREKIASGMKKEIKK